MKKQVIILVTFTAILFTGCSEKQNSPINSDSAPIVRQDISPEVSLLLEDYTIDEQVDISEMFEASSNFDYSNFPDSMYDFYLVKFLWGQLSHTSPTVNLPTDWSGSLSVNGPSFVFAVLPIDFEHSQDSLVPEDIPYGEKWVSSTQNDFDGILFLIVYDKLTPTFAPQILTFKTEPANLQFDFHQLIELKEFHEVDSSNSVAVYSHRIRPIVYREGYLAGRWIKKEGSNEQGRLEGLWFGHDGDTIGYLSGRFWTDEHGRGLLEGAVSGYFTDQVIAKLHGTWMYDDSRLCPICGAGHGQFKGRFVLLNRNINGSFSGEFGNYALPPDDRVMPFRGKWYFKHVIQPRDGGSTNPY